MTPERAQAREDLVNYHRALIKKHLDAAIAIEQKYSLLGLPPRLVSIGLQAAAAGHDHLAAVANHLKGTTDDR